MQTVLKGKTAGFIIDTEGPAVIIGESINPTRRKKLVTTFQESNFSLVLELSESQIKAGADVPDVNVGFPGVDDVKLLPETVKALQDHFDVPRGKKFPPLRCNKCNTKYHKGLNKYNTLSLQ